MISHWWTTFVFYLRTLARGELHRCYMCGKITQCFLLRESMRDHWAGANTPEKYVPEPYASMFLCLQCDSDIGDQLELHVHCCGVQPEER